MKIVASSLALELLLALTQRRDGARLSELSLFVGAALSSAQRAMRLLVADGLVVTEGRRRPRYRLRLGHPALDALRDLAFASLPADRVGTILARADHAIEFAALDRKGHVVVEAAAADPRDVLVFEDALARAAAVGASMNVLRLGHHDAVAVGRQDLELRRRLERARILKGSMARSFPRRQAAPPRRRPRRRRPLAPSLTPSARRAIASIAGTYGLRRMRLFGSAARGELGPASDVDVLVEPRVPSSVSLADLVRLEADLEDVFGRHVDLVTPGGLRHAVRDAIEREGVTIYG